VPSTSRNSAQSGVGLRASAEIWGMLRELCLLLVGGTNVQLYRMYLPDRKS